MKNINDIEVNNPEFVIKQETLEYGLLQHIKLCLECNNESQAIRLLEKYGFEKQEKRYSEEEVIDIAIKYFNHYYNISSRGRLLINHDLEWFEQFKKI